MADGMAREGGDGSGVSAGWYRCGSLRLRLGLRFGAIFARGDENRERFFLRPRLVAGARRACELVAVSFSAREIKRRTPLGIGTLAFDSFTSLASALSQVVADGIIELLRRIGELVDEVTALWLLALLVFIL